MKKIVAMTLVGLFSVVPAWSQTPSQASPETKPGVPAQPTQTQPPSRPAPPKVPLQGRTIPKSPSSDGLFDPYRDRSKPNTPEYPPLEDRRNKYQEILRTARREGRPEPNPSIQFLIDEVTVMGFLQVDGVSYVLCQAEKEMFRMKAGDRFYNGFIRSILPQKANRAYDPFVKVICAEQVTPKKNAEKILVGAYAGQP